MAYYSEMQVRTYMRLSREMITYATEAVTDEGRRGIERVIGEAEGVPVELKDEGFCNALTKLKDRKRALTF